MPALALLLMKRGAAGASWGRARTQKTDGSQCASRLVSKLILSLRPYMLVETLKVI